MNKRLIVFIAASSVLVILFCLFIVSLFFRRSELTTPSSPLPVPTSVLLKNVSPQDKAFSPFGKTTIGKTTKNEVEAKADVLNTQMNPDGTTQYSIKSVSIFHPDQILVKNNYVYFEKTSTFTNAQGGLPHISDYTALYGTPEEKIKGSKEYGAFTTIFLYPTKGFVFIVNDATNNIYEILRFSPMSLSVFKASYPEYVKPVQPAVE